MNTDERDDSEGAGGQPHEAGRSLDLEGSASAASAEDLHSPGGPNGTRSSFRPVRVWAQPGEKATNTLPHQEAPRPPVNARGDASASPKEHRINADLRTEEIIKGTHPGDRYIKIGRNLGAFKRRPGGFLSASLETDAARSSFGKVFNRVKRVLIGSPLSTEQSIHERLTNVKALAVLSSDALSSVAYATEEILRILIVAGAGAFSLALPLGGAIIVLLVIVVTSYRQTIAAYPRGGGSYIVARDNLGTLPGLAAASSILIGYILTVAVSVSAGVAALYSLFPAAEPFKVEICVGLVMLITLTNLRGLREAGNIFAVPTYLFIVGMLGLVVYGLVRVFFGVGGPVVYTPAPDSLPLGTGGVTILLMLRAFTQGSAALTGVEAIADGVPAFRPPEAKNARTTLLWMGGLSILMFGGITYLATHLQIRPSDAETVVSQIARSVFPPIFGLPALWYFIQIVTALILVLAANTAFSDFPRLSYFLARDKFMPRQYAFRGDRLAYSWGIITLAVLASILIIVFNGDTTALIPLYAIGVFSAFTFSQGGMVARWWRLRTPGWQRNLAVNLIGAITTFGVFVISSVTKFDQGTWIVLILIPLIIVIFLAINRHYRRFARAVEEAGLLVPRDVKHTVIVPVSSLNNIALSALNYAASLHSHVTAVHITEGEDAEEASRFYEEWHRKVPDSNVSLVIIESPYRSLAGPLLSYIDALDQQNPDDTITVVLPEMLPASPWEYILHGQSALRLKARLLFRPNTIVANIPYRVSRLGESNRLGRFGQIPWAFLFAAAILLAAVYWLFFPQGD